MKNRRHQKHTSHATSNSDVWMAVAEACIAIIGKAINAYFEKR